MIETGYRDAGTLEKRIKACQEWLKNPRLLKRDTEAEYAAVIEINLAELKEPILACPNDPDDVRLLSEVAGDRIDEVFIGSCMTNIGHSGRQPGYSTGPVTPRPESGWPRPPGWIISS